MACRVSSEVSTPRTISIRSIIGGGLNQCEPITRSGRDVCAPSAEIENCEVLEAKITSSRHTPSRRPSTSALTPRSSITHSITWSAASPAFSSCVE